MDLNRHESLLDHLPPRKSVPVSAMGNEKVSIFFSP